MAKYGHEVIFCIVNSGFADEVMDAARKLGAKGGTVIRARGTASAEAEKLYNIAVQPEKEIVMILINSKIKNDMLHGLYNAVGLNTPCQGIAFTMPVDGVVGIPIEVEDKPEKEEHAAPKTKRTRQAQSESN